jgi:hemerythrin
MKHERTSLLDILKVFKQVNRLSLPVVDTGRRASVKLYSEDTVSQATPDATNNVTQLLHGGCSNESEMLQLIQQLEQENSQINFCNEHVDAKKGCTILHTASRLNYVNVMNHLIQKHSYLIETCDKTGATPIFYACASANKEAVTVLAVSGANLNVHDSYEASPLSVSLNSKNKTLDYPAARTLLEFHVDIEFKIYGSNTILHMACKEGDLEKVQFIVKDLKHNIFRKDTRQESVLFRAVKHEQICSFLLQYCNDCIGHAGLLKLISMVNDQKRTVIHHCCAKGYKHSLLHIIESLKNDESKLITLFNEKDGTFGLTPLHISVLADQEDIFSILIRAKEVKLDIQSNKGDTALHIAIRQHKVTMVKELYHLFKLEYPKSLQLKNDQRKTISQMAKDYEIDLAKLENELEGDNAGIEKESIWSQIFHKTNKLKKKKKKTTKHEALEKMESQKKSQLMDISWDPSQYKLGHELIDDQHSELIGLLKNLSDYAMTSSSHWVVGYVIGCCMEYTETHFKDEQNEMEKYKKQLGEEYDKHMEQHVMFVSKMKSVHREYLNNHSTSLDVELLHYLVDWLVKHIHFTDRKLVQFMSSHQSDSELL